MSTPDLKCEFSLPPGCPLSSTHRQLEAVHISWHQLLSSESDLDFFTANLNATIVALRSVSFRLQAEKALFRDFQWYETWVARARSDKLLKWLSDARTHTLKVSDLTTLSSVKATLCHGWYQRTVHHVIVPPETPKAEMVRLVKSRLPIPKDCPALIMVERKWLVADFPQTDLLDIIRHGYKEMRELVALAHERIGDAKSCVKFISRGLPCLEQQTRQSLAISGDETLDIIDRDIPEPKPEDMERAAKHYGIVKGADPFGPPEAILEHAKTVMSTDGYHMALAFVRSGGSCGIAILPAEDRTEKVVMLLQLEKRVRREGADAVMFISEIWLYHPNFPRKEGLQVVKLERGTPGVTLVALVQRDGEKITFPEETIRQEGVPAAFRSIQDALAGKSELEISDLRPDTDIFKPGWSQTALGAFCHKHMVPAMAKEKPSLDEIIAYSVARSLAASVHYVYSIPLSERQAVVRGFISDFEADLPPEFKVALENVPFLDENTVSLWFEPRVAGLRKLTVTREDALAGCARLWAALWPIHSKLVGKYSLLNPPAEKLKRQLGLLRILEGFMMEYLSICSFHYAGQGKAVITTQEDGHDFVKVMLNEGSYNPSVSGRKFPHAFFESNLMLLPFLVTWGPSMLRFAFGDGSALSLTPQFNGPYVLRSKFQELHDFIAALMAAADTDTLQTGKEYQLRIGAGGVAKISVVKMVPAAGGLPGVFVKIVYDDNAREMAVMVRTAGHTCDDASCQAVRTGGIIVDFWSHKTTAAVDPSFTFTSVAHLLHIMAIVAAFIRDVVVAPQTLTLVRERKDRYEYRHAGKVYAPEVLTVEFARSIAATESALFKVLA